MYNFCCILFFTYLESIMIECLVIDDKKELVCPMCFSYLEEQKEDGLDTNVQSANGSVVELVNRLSN